MSKEAEVKYSANFLWGHDDDSIETLGYEFANAKTEEYQRECWQQLIDKLKNLSSPQEVTDEEIELEARRRVGRMSGNEHNTFLLAAKWMREKLNK